MSTEKAQIVQRLAFSEFISKYYPSEYINITETNALVNVQLGKYARIGTQPGNLYGYRFGHRRFHIRFYYLENGLVKRIGKTDW